MIAAAEQNILEEIADLLGINSFHHFLEVGVEVDTETVVAIDDVSPISIRLCINVGLFQQDLLHLIQMPFTNSGMACEALSGFSLPTPLIMA